MLVSVLAVLGACAPSGTPQAPVSAEEGDCSDGVDGDADGLLDCEDGDCVETCLEVDCADGGDDDADGRSDCDDEDCWSAAACQTPIGVPPGTQISSRVLGGQGSFQRIRYDHTWGGGGHQWRQTSSVVAEDIWGTARVLLPGASASTTCTWSVDSGTWSLWKSGDGSYGAGSNGEQESYLRRWGFDVDESCPLRSQGFLPTGFTFHTSAAAALGVLWYQGSAVASSNYLREHESWSFGRGGYTSSRFWSIHSFQTGEPFTVVIP